MSTIIPPWPPSDATAAMPYDQRGCCWPWGTFGPYEKLPMRYLAIGVRIGGAVGAVWGRWKTGQLLVCDSTLMFLKKSQYNGGHSVPPVLLDTLRIDYYHTTAQWFCQFQSTLDYFGNQHIYGSGLYDPSNPFADFNLIVDGATGGAAPPDYVVCKALRWYESSPYPFYGTL